MCGVCVWVGGSRSTEQCSIIYEKLHVNVPEHSSVTSENNEWIFGNILVGERSHVLHFRRAEYIDSMQQKSMGVTEYL